MIVTWRWRSLAAHPVRTRGPRVGFGLGVCGHGHLLGVGEVVLDQARAPALSTAAATCSFTGMTVRG